MFGQESPAVVSPTAPIQIPTDENRSSRSPILRLQAAGPIGRVTTLQFTPDSTRLMAAGWDKQVDVWQWDRTAGQFLHRSEATVRVPVGTGLQGALNCLATSPDGRWLAVAGRGVVRNLASFRQPGLVVKTTDVFTEPMWLDEGTIYLLDQLTGQFQEFRGHRGAVLNLLFLPTPNLSNQKPQTNLKPIPGHLLSLAEEWVAEQRRFLPTFRLWDLENKKISRSLQLLEPLEPEDRNLRVHLTAWAIGQELDQIVAVATYGTNLVVANFQSQQVHKKSLNAPCFTLLDNANSLWLGTAFSLGSLQQIPKSFFTDPSFTTPQALSQIRESKPFKLSSWPGPQLPLAPAFPVALQLISANETHPDLIAVLADQTAGNPFRCFLINPKQSNSILQTMALWHSNGTQPQLAASPDGHWLAISGAKGNAIMLYAVNDLLNGKLEPQILQHRADFFSDVQFVRHTQTEAKRGLRFQPAGPSDQPLILSLQDRLLVPASKEWRIDSGKSNLWQIKLSTFNNAVKPQKLTQAPSMQRYEIFAGERIVGEFILPITSRITASAFSPTVQPPVSGDTLMALALREAGNIKLQLLIIQPSKKTVRKLREFVGHTEIIQSLNFDGEGKLLASAAADGTVAIWQVSDIRSDLLGKRSQLEDLAVRTRTVTLNSTETTVAEIVNVSEAFKERLPLSIQGKVVAGLYQQEKFQPIESAEALANYISRIPPASIVRLRITAMPPDTGNAVDINCLTTQLVDERKPLYQIVVTRPAMPGHESEQGQRDWLGWSPLGPFESNRPEAEHLIGWHFNTGDPQQPTQFAPASEYRQT